MHAEIFVHAEMLVHAELFVHAEVFVHKLKCSFMLRKGRILVDDRFCLVLTCVHDSSWTGCHQ